MIDRLREIAIRFKIETESTVAHAARLGTVIRVLSDIQASYRNFLQIEFLKQSDFRAAFEQNASVLDTLMDELQLLVVDLNFSSYETAVAPNILDNQTSLFRDEVKDWKRQSFGLYRDLIIGGRYEESGYVRNVAGRYSERERREIFKPLFASVGPRRDYTIAILDSERAVAKRLIPPPEDLFDFYVPTLSKSESETEENTVQIFAKVRKQGGEYNLTKQNIRKVYMMEELEHDTYPFKTDVLRTGDSIYLLSERIEGVVSWEEEQYMIDFTPLGISVWAGTREEVEEAFAFAFHALYVNYADETDENLTPKAQVIKTLIRSLVKQVIHEAA